MTQIKYVGSSSAVLGQRIEPRRQLWQAEDLAARWGLDPASLGNIEAGNELGSAAAQLRLPGQTVLLDYLRRCYVLEEQVLDELDDQQFQERRLDPQSPPDQSVGFWLMNHMIHEWEHLGMIRYLQGRSQVMANTGDSSATILKYYAKLPEVVMRKVAGNRSVIPSVRF